MLSTGKNLNFFLSFEENLNSQNGLKWFLHRKRANGYFLLTSFFSIVQYRGRNSKKINFSKKSSNGLNWILDYKRALKRFFLTSCYSPLEYRVRNSEKINFLKKTFNLKFVRSKPKFYAKYEDWC